MSQVSAGLVPLVHSRNQTPPTITATTAPAFNQLLTEVLCSGADRSGSGDDDAGGGVEGFDGRAYDRTADSGKTQRPLFVLKPRREARRA